MIADQKMNPEIKALWVKALRSSQYPQCQEVLRDEDAEGYSYCCMGVLKDIHSIQHRLDWDDPIYDEETPELTAENKGFLPTIVKNWAGLAKVNPEVEFEIEDIETEDKLEIVPLSELNDIYCLTFSQIADLIEAQL